MARSHESNPVIGRRNFVGDLVGDHVGAGHARDFQKVIRLPREISYHQVI